MKSTLWICTLLFWLFCSAPGIAGNQMIEIGSLTTCAAPTEIDLDSIFQTPACREQVVRDIDLVNQNVWARTHLQIKKTNAALGLFISGSASTAVYLNGAFIGQNGEPGKNRGTEIPGKMDSVIYLPPHLLKDGENSITLHLSSHHGFLGLQRPLHRIHIGPYSLPTGNILRRYLPSLLSFGVFLAGSFYFGGMALRSFDRTGSLLLSLMSFSALGQLSAEVWRGVSAYAYPVHEVRLLLILFFALGFGFCVTAYIHHRLGRTKWWKPCAFIAVMTIVITAAMPGYDTKTITAILAPTLLNAGYLLCLLIGKRLTHPSYLAALLLFFAAVFFSPTEFLDVSFYYILASLLSFLFIRQARYFAEERRQRIDETARAQRLADTLKRAQKGAAMDNITITNKGKLELVTTEALVYGKGAGDYVELHFKAQKNYKLYSGSVGQLEHNLPLTFVRVHRSYIVNTAYVKGLVSVEKGGGKLDLTGNIQVPVSRRIMPKVRALLENSSAKA
ncbi:LytR/AlgR family response regulator transcription factor [Kordiimonas sp.]|uniref:LytR/AlgR family response regulator transcription factor n=1 Tax=Kordiimonas sp. TaxID=1970157 RepID=UPI003B52A004